MNKRPRSFHEGIFHYLGKEGRNKVGVSEPRQKVLAGAQNNPRKVDDQSNSFCHSSVKIESGQFRFYLIICITLL